MIKSPFLLWMLRVIGTVLAVTSAKLTWDFGSQVSFGMGLALLTVSVIASYMFAIALEITHSNNKFARPMFFVACVVGSVAFLADAVTNGSTVNVYSAANQHGAKVQTVKHDLVHAKVSNNAELLATFRKQLADLQAANPWAATVSADGLKDQIKALRNAEVAEANLGGCGPKCRAIQNQIVEVQGKIAVAEQSNDLTSRISALQKVVNQATDVAAVTEKGFSVTEQRSLRLASLLTGTREPGDESTWWTDLVMWSIVGAIITMCSAFANTLGWVSSRPAEMVHTAVEAVQHKMAHAVPAIAAVAAAPQPEAARVGFIPTTAQSAATATPHGDYLSRLMAGAGASRVALGSA